MSEAVECLAQRRGRAWVGRVAAYGVYGHGPTLKALRVDIAAGLAHLDVTAPVTLVVETPELAHLRSVANDYTTALRAAVTTLALRSMPPADIALATGAPITRVKALLAERATSPTNLDPASPLDGAERDPLDTAKHLSERERKC
ncbi:hypothetical protein [Nocardia noduli]|uniref:hypothetical protein n=1 Tax=Nocardia noduli TaxID=2815722 RepID=UPI001C2497CA|nr:hypothetical protein [Nocardia noduli]